MTLDDLKIEYDKLQLKISYNHLLFVNIEFVGILQASTLIPLKNEHILTYFFSFFLPFFIKLARSHCLKIPIL